MRFWFGIHLILAKRMRFKINICNIILFFVNFPFFDAGRWKTYFTSISVEKKRLRRHLTPKNLFLGNRMKKYNYLLSSARKFIFSCRRTLKTIFFPTERRDNTFTHSSEPEKKNFLGNIMKNRNYALTDAGTFFYHFQRLEMLFCASLGVGKMYFS